MCNETINHVIQYGRGSEGRRLGEGSDRVDRAVGWWLGLREVGWVKPTGAHVEVRAAHAIVS